jgi:ankyrin repeat and BTB/POZ domain-containing protein 1
MLESIPRLAALDWSNDDYELEENELPEPFEWRSIAPAPPIGDETVFTAAARGDISALRGLVELKGAAIDDRDEFDAVPLYYASLCGHYETVEYLLCRGARCEVDTFDTTRCVYAALTDAIRKLLRHFQAANRNRGPLLAFTFRIFNLASSYGAPDVAFVVGAGVGRVVIRAHRAVLSARCRYFARKFAHGGRWSGRARIALVDPRMRGAALVAVLGYIYTERLLVAPAHLEDVAAISANLGLAELREFAEAEASAMAAKGLGAVVRAVARDFGAVYAVGSFPMEAGADAEAGACASLRCDFFFNLVHSGVVPPAALRDLRAAGDDLADDGSIEAGTDDWAAVGGCDDSRGLHHDVEIMVRGRAIFRAHRFVLCGRSRFFDSLLAFREGDDADILGDRGGADDPLERELRAVRPAPLARIELDDVSPFVFSVVLEFLYSDCVRTIPSVELALEALSVAESYLLNDGIKPLLVAQAAAHIRLDTVCDVFRAATLFNNLRLGALAARFAASELDAVVADAGFEALVRADADAVVGRQEYDSVPVVDDVRAEVRALPLPGPERERRLKLLDDLCARLGLKVRR